MPRTWAVHSSRVKVRTGPSGSFESRTYTWSPNSAVSTHAFVSHPVGLRHSNSVAFTTVDLPLPFWSPAIEDTRPGKGFSWADVHPQWIGGACLARYGSSRRQRVRDRPSRG